MLGGVAPLLAVQRWWWFPFNQTESGFFLHAGSGAFPHQAAEAAAAAAGLPSPTPEMVCILFIDSFAYHEDGFQHALFGYCCRTLPLSFLQRCYHTLTWIGFSGRRTAVAWCIDPFITLTAPRWFRLF